jgi:hypothetical protein
MKRTQQLLWGLAIMAGCGVLASQPAWSFTIDFDDAETNYRTYTNDPDPDALYNYGESAAIRALTDGDINTNVELTYKSEVVSENVGFSATRGNQTAKISSVTTADWDEYGQAWMNDLFKRYDSFQTSWSSLSSSAQSVFTESFKSAGLGDPNIAEFSLQEDGAIAMQTVGFYDLRSVLSTRASAQLANYNTLQQLAGASSVQKAAVAAKAGISVTALEQQIASAPAVIEGLSALLTTIDNLKEELQASEVAKVERYENGILQSTEYAYTFEAVSSGLTALDDGESYSGLYSWTSPGTTQNSGVPEPSFLIASAVAGGFFSAAKRKQKKG